MSAFNSLAALHLKVCNDSTHTPFQWIYVIDDAWFHHQTIDKLKPVFTSNNSDKARTGSLPYYMDSTGFSSEITITTSEDLLETSGANGSSEGSSGPQSDKETAAKLIEYIGKWKDEHCDYGLCFCTFEYFWTNIEKINEPQNAVFFDLRHQLASKDRTGLLGEWLVKIKDIQFVDEATAGKAELLGWILYFAFKFGRIPRAENCYIDHNHFLIISSAISAAGEDRDAIAQYLEMQQAIFAKLSEDENLKAKARPSHFTFAPLPKNHAAGDNCFELGLTVFHNSFREKASWSGENGVASKMLCDLRVVWTKSNHWGHPDDVPCLRWLDWANEWEETKLIYNFSSEKTSVLHYGQFVALLKSSMVLRHYEKVALQQVGDQILSLPTNPGIHYLVVLFDFIDNLKEDRSKSDLRVRPSLETQFDDGYLLIKITLNQEGVNRLKERYESAIKNPSNIKTTGAIPPLFQLGTLQGTHEYLIKNRFGGAGISFDSLAEDKPSCCFSFDTPIVPDFTNDKVTLKIKLKE